LLAVRRGAMPDDIGSVAIGAVEYLSNHHGSLSHGEGYSSQTHIQDSRSTTLKHLRSSGGANWTPGKSRDDCPASLRGLSRNI
jgi:hypothetical protein